MKQKIREEYKQIQRDKNLAESHQIEEEIKAEYDNKTEEEKQVIDGVHAIFEKHDLDKDGMLSIKEIGEYFKTELGDDSNKQMVDNIFKKMDADKNNFVSKTELIEYFNSN